MFEDESVLVPAVLAERYRLTRELGRGGMAVVHLAWDLKHERDVAVKVLRPADNRDQILLRIRCWEIYPDQLEIPEAKAIIDKLDLPG